MGDQHLQRPAACTIDSIFGDNSVYLVCLHTDGQVEGLGTGSKHAATLPQELHALYLVMNQQGRWLLDVEECVLQRIQVAVISLSRHPNARLEIRKSGLD